MVVADTKDATDSGGAPGLPGSAKGNNLSKYAISAGDFESHGLWSLRAHVGQRGTSEDSKQNVPKAEQTMRFMRFS